MPQAVPKPSAKAFPLAAPYAASFTQMSFLARLLFFLGAANTLIGLGILISIAAVYPFLPASHVAYGLSSGVFAGVWTVLLGSLLILASGCTGRVRCVAKIVAAATGLIAALLVLASRFIG